jgi:hypothetical protein
LRIIWPLKTDYNSDYTAITIGGDFSGSDTIAVIDLQGTAADWLWKSVLERTAEYTGTIPVSRFSLGNFVNSSGVKTPIASYVINSEGKLVNKQGGQADTVWEEGFIRSYAQFCLNRSKIR